MPIGFFNRATSSSTVFIDKQRQMSYTQNFYVSLLAEKRKYTCRHRRIV